MIYLLKLQKNNEAPFHEVLFTAACQSLIFLFINVYPAFDSGIITCWII